MLPQRGGGSGDGGGGGGGDAAVVVLPLPPQDVAHTFQPVATTELSVFHANNPSVEVELLENRSAEPVCPVHALPL